MVRRKKAAVKKKPGKIELKEQRKVELQVTLPEQQTLYLVKPVGNLVEVKVPCGSKFSFHRSDLAYLAQAILDNLDELPEMEEEESQDLDEDYEDDEY